MDEVRDTLLCEVANEIEAAMVVNLLTENEIPAHSDASPAGTAFGGLPFEPGHKVYVAASLARKALEKSWKAIPISRNSETSTSLQAETAESRRSMTHDEQRPLRVCYVVSYFHPFESGAERQALAQGSELARRGHSVHVVTKAIPGYPVRDEEFQGVFIHRWIKTVAGGPLFALSFLTGVARALRTTAVRDRRHPHPPGPLGGGGDGAGTALLARQANADTARERGLLRRGTGAQPNARRRRTEASDPCEHRFRGDLRRDRTRVARTRCPSVPDGANGERG